MYTHTHMNVNMHVCKNGHDGLTPSPLSKKSRTSKIAQKVKDVIA